jgi:hypothetical protein
MKVKLVKWDYDSFPKEWKEQNPNPLKGIVFACLGEIEGMKGHSYCQDTKTGKPFVLDTDNLIELTEEEL